MSFNDNVRLDPSRVSDRRGRGRSAAVGGGIGGGVVLLILSLILGPDRACITGQFGMVRLSMMLRSNRACRRMIKNIRLTGDPAEIECNAEKVKGLVLRTEFLKKA